MRQRRGRGFRYRDEDGTAVDDPETLARIDELAIPPAWDDVWICPYPGGHIQATGVDAAGRKQYLYHSRWRELRDMEKFDDMVAFARRLPRLRRRVEAALEGDGELDYERVCACAVRLLDRGFFRVGSEDYAVRNETYGLATMKKSHVRLRGGVLVFDYPSKQGKRRVQAVIDPAVAEIVGALKRRRGGGDDLLAFKRGRHWVDLRSEDINAWLKGAIGDNVSAKDFRTWGATVLAAVALAVSGEAAGTKSGRRRAIKRAIEEVAHYLGNTPAIARASYIDPRVFDRYLSGWTIAPALEDGADAFGLERESTRQVIEEAVVDLISEPRSSEHVEKLG